MKKLLIIFLGSTIITSSELFCQSRWLMEYFENLNVFGEDFIESYDYGYLMAGKYGPNYVHYSWLIKTDINGEILWEKTFGEPNSYTAFLKISQKNTGEIFLSGGTSYYDAFMDPIVMKLNACGEKEWCQVFNIPNHFDYAYSIIATDDGGCAVILRYTGVTPPQTDRICLAKLDSQGNLLWKQCYNSNDTNLISEDPRSIILTPDRGYLITGVCDYLDTDSTQMYWPKQYYIKTDSLGNFEWETVVHNDNNKVGGDAWTTTLNPDSTYYYSSVSHYYFETNYSSPAMIKMDLDGNVVAIYDIVNGYINGGLTHAKFINNSTLYSICVFGNSQDDISTLIANIDTIGNILNFIELEYDIYDATLNLSYDHKLLAFFTALENEQFDVYLRKLNLNLEDDTLYTAPFTYDSLCPYQIVSDTIVQDDCGLIVGIVEEDENSRGREGERMEIWPNPVGDVIHVRMDAWTHVPFPKDVTMTIYDIYGRAITSSTLLPFTSSKEITLDISSYPPGLYIAVISNNKQVISTAKFVIDR